MKKYLFHGDSITDAGRNREDLHSLTPGGYTQMVADRYNKDNEPMEFFNRSMSGFRTTEILTVLSNDIDTIKPDIVSMLIGVNDVWRMFDANTPTTDEQFEKNYLEIIREIKDSGAKLIILGPYFFHTPTTAGWDEEFEHKRNIVKKLADQYADGYVDLQHVFSTISSFNAPCERFSPDGVHPTERGCEIIADCCLKCIESL